MRFFIFLSFVIFLMVFGGCSSAEKQKIDRVDSLYSVIEAVEDSMEIVSIAKVNRLIDENQNLLIKVQNQTKDTLTKEQMFFCSDFKRYRKTLTQLVQNIEFQVGQIGYSKTQLENLKEDVKNGLIIDEHFNNYFSSEKESIARLKESSDNITAWYKGTFKRYDELKKGVEQILENK